MGLCTTPASLSATASSPAGTVAHLCAVEPTLAAPADCTYIAIPGLGSMNSSGEITDDSDSESEDHHDEFSFRALSLSADNGDLKSGGYLSITPGSCSGVGAYSISCTPPHGDAVVATVPVSATAATWFLADSGLRLEGSPAQSISASMTRTRTPLCKPSSYLVIENTSLSGMGSDVRKGPTGTVTHPLASVAPRPEKPAGGPLHVALPVAPPHPGPTLGHACFAADFK